MTLLTDNIPCTVHVAIAVDIRHQTLMIIMNRLSINQIHQQMSLDINFVEFNHSPRPAALTRFSSVSLAYFIITSTLDVVDIRYQPPLPSYPSVSHPSPTIIHLLAVCHFDLWFSVRNSQYVPSDPPRYSSSLLAQPFRLLTLRSFTPSIIANTITTTTVSTSNCSPPHP